MLTNPYLATELAPWTARDMLAQAAQQHLVRQLRELARASRRAERAPAADNRFPKAQPPPGGASPINHTAAANSRPKKGGSPWPP
jgi:hypothetical protein